MNTARRRGTAWETAVVAYLNEHGYPHAERRALRGTDDRGDIAGIPGVVLECKAVREISLAAIIDETAAEGRNAGARIAAAIVKRRQKGVGDAYVVMTLDGFLELLGEVA